MATSAEDEAFLEAIEEEFKHRYTEDDEEFMRVFTAAPSAPPIMEDWHSKRCDRHRRRPADADPGAHRSKRPR